MAEGGFEMTDFRRPEDSVLDEGRVETTDVDEAFMKVLQWIY